MTSLTKRSLLTAAAAIALLGCGSLTSQGAALIEQAHTPSAVKAALVQHFANIRSGDSKTAFAGYTQRCRLAIGEQDFEVHLSFERLALQTATGGKLSALRLGDISVDFTPDRAAVTFLLYFTNGTLVPNADPPPAEMVYEDGRWRSDSCQWGD
jgi:hypothetical protein